MRETGVSGEGTAREKAQRLGGKWVEREMRSWVWTQHSMWSKYWGHPGKTCLFIHLLKTFFELPLYGTQSRQSQPCPCRALSLVGKMVVVQSLSHVWLFLSPHGLQQARLLYSLSPGVCLNSWPLSQWWYLTISSSATLFSPCLQCLPALGSFTVSQFFASGGQSIGASASVLPTNIRGWFPLGFTGLISFLSKGLSRVFSNTTVQKHQFFSPQLSLYSNSHIHTWLLEKP